MVSFQAKLCSFHPRIEVEFKKTLTSLALGVGGVTLMICYLLIFAMFVGIKTIRETSFSHFAYVCHDYFIFVLFIPFFFCVYVLKINNIT